jgi:hypothetical protein
MKITIDTSVLYPAVDYKALAQEMKAFIAKQPKTRENALRWAIGTGMYTKTGKLKKQFR